MNAELHHRILALYAEVDAAVAAIGPKCDASGRCCRFKEFGHTLFISRLEAEVLLESAPPFQQPVTDEFCPFQKENLCTCACALTAGLPGLLLRSIVSGVRSRDY